MFLCSEIDKMDLKHSTKILEEMRLKFQVLDTNKKHVKISNNICYNQLLLNAIFFLGITFYTIRHKLLKLKTDYQWYDKSFLFGATVV